MPSVLIIDDDVHGAELMKAMLETEGHRVRVSVGGAEGIESAVAEKPDLITVDVRMPGMDGFEACRRLRADARTRDVPLLMVTALTRTEDMEQGIAAGVDDFISKPIKRLEYLARVKSLLRVSHLKGELDRTLAYLQDLEKL